MMERVLRGGWYKGFDQRFPKTGFTGIGLS